MYLYIYMFKSFFPLGKDSLENITSEKYISVESWWPSQYEGDTCFIFSIMVYHRVLNIVPHAIQKHLVVYPFTL